VKIEWQGRVYALDLDDLTLKQGEAIQDYMGMPVTEWEQALQSKGADLLKALGVTYWLMMRQNGEDPGALEDVDFPLAKFSRSLSDAFARETAANAPDPTKPPAKKPAAKRQPRAHAG
jgi:hypothetical protein